MNMNEQQNETKNQMFSLDQVARKLGISNRKLWELKNSGAIRHCRIGRRVLFASEWIEQFIESNSAGGK